MGEKKRWIHKLFGRKKFFKRKKEKKSEPEMTEEERLQVAVVATELLFSGELDELMKRYPDTWEEFILQQIREEKRKQEMKGENEYDDEEDF